MRRHLKSDRVFFFSFIEQNVMHQQGADQETNSQFVGHLAFKKLVLAQHWQMEDQAQTGTVQYIYTVQSSIYSCYTRQQQRRQKPAPLVTRQLLQVADWPPICCTVGPLLYGAPFTGLQFDAVRCHGNNTNHTLPLPLWHSTKACSLFCHSFTMSFFLNKCKLFF